MEPGTIQQIGMLADGITFASPDGVSITAPQEVWIAAIMSIFTPTQRAEVCRLVEKYMANQITARAPDGTQYKISKMAY